MRADKMSCGEKNFFWSCQDFSNGPKLFLELSKKFRELSRFFEWATFPRAERREQRRENKGERTREQGLQKLTSDFIVAVRCELASHCYASGFNVSHFGQRFETFFSAHSLIAEVSTAVLVSDVTIGLT